jgi:drug/metabolite transporter (DMT)-like permease
MTASDWGLILALSVIWGGAFFSIEIILRQVPPNSMVLLRLALALPPLFLWMHFKGQSMPMDLTSWRSFLILGLLNIALPFVLFAYGQVHLSGGLASILNATTPLWGVLVAHFLTDDEKATPMRVVGVFIGFAGVAVMLGDDATSTSDQAIWAQLACIVATLFYGFGSIFGRRLGHSGMTPLQLATGQVAGGALLMLPIVLLTETPWAGPFPGAETWMAAIGLSIISTSLAYILYFRLLESAGATNSLLITFLVPVTAILLGAIFLDEVLSLRTFAGVALIAVGLALLDGRLFANRALA